MESFGFWKRLKLLIKNLHVVIRNTVRAVIVKNGYVLLLMRKNDLKGCYYSLPGGGQEYGETLLEALQRECREEIATSVIVKRIEYIADFFKPKSTPKAYIQHRLEILFYCQVPKSYIPQSGPKPDKNQVRVEWVALNKLDQIPLAPSFLAEILKRPMRSSKPTYLGKFG